jgi:hypothetical protein
MRSLLGLVVVELAVLLALEPLDAPDVLEPLDLLEAVEVKVVVTDAAVEVKEVTEAEVADETDAELTSPPLIVNGML